MIEVSSVKEVDALRTAEDLQSAAQSYNWDDGFEIPRAIAEHPSCDLAVALELYSLADGLSVYLGEVEERSYNRDHIEFCRLLCERLLAGYYRSGSAKFKSDLSAVQMYKLRKQGVPELLISGESADHV